MTAVPEEPGVDAPRNAQEDVDDVADDIPDGDLAAQSESAWPDDDAQDLVPDGDRVVPDLDEG
jgi:hypothetical protein